MSRDHEIRGSDPTLERVQKKRKHFSIDTANDLLFWGAQLALVGISLGVLWIKVDGTTRAMKRVISAQERELQIAEKEADAHEVAEVNARNAERTRSIQLQAAVNSLNTVLSQVSEIQADIKRTLATATEINQRVLAQSESTKSAAIQAQSAAQNAAGAASGAAGAAYKAAANSTHTAGVVATKVETSADKARLQAQQRALARKQAQLAKTIKQVKKNGPNLLQQIFH